MTTKHTPGPWSVEPLKGFRKFAIIGPDRHEWNGCRQSVAYTGASYSQNREANARLIAAAPELVEALRECAPYVSQAWVETGDPATADRHERARALLAKIDGEQA